MRQAVLLLALLLVNAAVLAEDKIDAGGAEVTGNRELPKVLHVMPWHRPSAEDLQGKPVNTLLDEAIEPINRDVFRRQVEYYHSLSRHKSGRAPGNSQPDEAGR